MRQFNALETDLNTGLCLSPGCILPGSDTLPAFSSLALCSLWKKSSNSFYQHRFSPALPLLLYRFWLA